jgi:hypothetical protein
MFHPGWFSSFDLIRHEELKDCKIGIIHPDVTEFRFDWIRIHVEQQIFQAIVFNNAYFEQLRDFVIGTISVLEEIEITALGLNRELHFRASSRERYDAFGDMIAPKTIWEKQGEGKYGLLEMIMEYKQESHQGYIKARIAPSVKLKPDFGIQFDFNNHYDIEDKDSKKYLEIIQDNWQKDSKRTLQLAEGLLSETDEYNK